MTPKEILDLICSENNLTYRDLANLIGVKEQHFYDISSGRIKKISKNLAEKIYRIFPDYSVLFLMTGSNVTTVNVDMSENSGVIAHDARDISNVSGSEDAGTAKAKDEEIKALKAEIKAVKAENRQLRAQIDALTQTVLNLSKK